jgi:hypothetical protein
MVDARAWNGIYRNRAWTSGYARLMITEHVAESLTEIPITTETLEVGL